MKTGHHLLLVVVLTLNACAHVVESSGTRENANGEPMARFSVP